MGETMDGLPLQIKVQGKYLRRFAHAIGERCQRGNNPCLTIVAPPNERHEILALAKIICEGYGVPRVIENTELDFDRRIWQESNPDPILVPDGTRLPKSRQKRLAEFFNNPQRIHPFMFLVIINRDPGDLLKEGVWNPLFRELFVARQFRLPPMMKRLPSADSRHKMFKRVFREIVSYHASNDDTIEEEATQLIRQYFEEKAPPFMESYVNLASACIRNMRAREKSLLDAEVFKATIRELESLTSASDLSEAMHSPSMAGAFATTSTGE